MTAEEFLQGSITISHFYNDRYEQMMCFSDDVQKAMKEYARLKCQELLEIVAEKAEITKSVNFGWEKVDKGSILSAVDLDKFIV